MESDSTNPDTDAPTAASVNGMLESCRPSGLVIHGPAGNGKTHAAMCLAASLGLNCVKARKVNLLKVRSSEVFSQWIGGSEVRSNSFFQSFLEHDLHHRVYSLVR
jgi:SpoVK/Ycf46/Vps4 family AAA+-type ATPase